MFDKNNIQESRDYDLFKLVSGNRQVHSGHVKNLISSIAKKNMLNEHPVLVNEKMEIIDGQHRFNACRALGLPVPYVVINGANLGDVQLLNAHNKPWQPRDYLDSFVVLGNRDYIELKEFIETYKISITIALQLLSGSTARPHELLREFKDGEFKVVDRENAEMFADRLFELEGYAAAGVWRDREYLNALVLFYRSHDHAPLIKNLRAGRGRITRSLTTGDYLRQLEKIAGVC